MLWHKTATPQPRCVARYNRWCTHSLSVGLSKWTHKGFESCPVMFDDTGTNRQIWWKWGPNTPKPTHTLQHQSTWNSGTGSKCGATAGAGFIWNSCICSWNRSQHITRVCVWIGARDACEKLLWALPHYLEPLVSPPHPCARVVQNIAQPRSNKIVSVIRCTVPLPAVYFVVARMLWPLDENGRHI